MRSKLFVPGSRTELFPKAAASAADALSFDLEDAVAPTRKEEARRAVAAYLRDHPLPHGKIAIVRVNALGSGLFEADAEALGGPGIAVINLPKVESAADIRRAAAAIAPSIGLLATIETPRALRLVHEIATADPRVVGLQLGFGDLLLPYGIDRSSAAALDHARAVVRFAAAEAGIPCYDGAWFDVTDVSGCRAEAEAARRLGFAGKSCIHPSQIEPINEVFRPDPAAVAHAVRVIAAAHEAQAQGVGAFVVDGQLVDGPILTAARHLAAAAMRAGMIDAPSP